MNDTSAYILSNHFRVKKKSRNDIISALLLLDYQDSNLEKQDQNLLCYHYTIVQSFNRTTRSVFDDAKILLFIYTPNFSRIFLPTSLKKVFKSPVFLFNSIITLSDSHKKVKNKKDFISFFLFIQ